MRTQSSSWLLVVLLVGLGAAAAAAGEVSGHWEGAIELPGTALTVLVDLVDDRRRLERHHRHPDAGRQGTRRWRTSAPPATP